MPSKSTQQIVITGLPRSGTTLTCHLLNKLPNCVALHEPLIPLEFAGYNRDQLIEKVLDYFSAQRIQILQTGTAASKSFGGQVPDNPMAGLDPVTGKRVRVLDGNTVNINKRLAADFRLAIKQPAFFTAILKDLVQEQSLSCFAVIRNPLSVLLSWNSVEMPVSRGRVPAAEAFSGDLKTSLDRILEVYDRQLFLLDWFFQQYINYLPHDQIIFYENTIKTAGQSLAIIDPEASSLNEALSSKNDNDLYDKNLKDFFLGKLLNSPKASFWTFYSKNDLLV